MQLTIGKVDILEEVVNTLLDGSESRLKERRLGDLSRLLRLMP